MKIYGRTVALSANQYNNPVIRENVERICLDEVAYQTGQRPEQGTWRFVPAHEASWTDPDTGEEQVSWIKDQWWHVVEAEVADDWEEKRDG